MKKIFFLPLTAQSRWYTSQEAGSDSNNNQRPTNPFQSVNKAINMLTPDDTLIFWGTFTNNSYDPNFAYNNNINAPHIWTQENSIQINQLTGTPGYYITLKAYDEYTVLKRDKTNISWVMKNSYLIFDGIGIEREVNQIPLSTAKVLQFLYEKNDTVSYRVPPDIIDNHIASMSFQKLNNIKRPSNTDTCGPYFSIVLHLDTKNMLIHYTLGGGLHVASGNYINTR